VPWAILTALVASTASASLPGFLELTLRARDAPSPLLTLPLEPGERFTLRYRHSVDGTPVWEVHSVDRHGVIRLEEERGVLFGAGMSHWPGHGRLTRQDATPAIVDIGRPLGDFLLRVGSPAVGHTLLWRGRGFPLSEWVPGERVAVDARVVGPLRRLWNALRHPIPPPRSGER
jgi:hypothetical protein